MAASVSAIYNLLLVVDETLGLSEPHAADPTIRHDMSSEAVLSGVLNATSSPAATKVFSGTVTIAGGLTNLDLMSLAGPEGTIDFSTLKPQLIIVAAHLVNIATINIKTKDTTTGYNLFGADNTGSEEYALLIGQSGLFRTNGKGQTVDATHKDISFSGGNGNIARVIIVAG